MKNAEEIREELKPLLKMVKDAKLSNSKEFLKNVEDFKNFLISNNICGIKDNPQFLDKLVDEIIEQE